MNEFIDKYHQNPKQEIHNLVRVSKLTKSAPLFNVIGVHYLLVEPNDIAESYFIKALELEQNPIVYYNLGKYYEIKFLDNKCKFEKVYTNYMISLNGGNYMAAYSLCKLYIKYFPNNPNLEDLLIKCAKIGIEDSYVMLADFYIDKFNKTGHSKYITQAGELYKVYSQEKYEKLLSDYKGII